VTAVRSSTRPDEPVLAFPALALVSFLADRRTPSADDYFFPGDPDHAGEAALIDALEATRTPLLVAFDRPGYFAGSQAYYFLLRDYVRSHFVPLRQIGAVGLFVRREAADAPAGAPRAQLEPAAPRRVPFASGADRPFVQRARRIAAHGRRADLLLLTPGLVDVDRSVRQETIAAVLRVARRDPEGLGGAAAAVAPDQRSTLVLLRGLGEFAGREALPFLAAALRNDSPRVREEAAAATKLLLVRDLEERYRWSIAEPGPYWDLPALPAVDLAERLAPGADERSATLAALAVAQEGRREARPALERILAEPTTLPLTRLFVVAALVRLGEPDTARQLVALAGSPSAAAPYAAAMLLDETIVARRDAAAAVATSLREGDVDEREAAVWASRVLGDASAADAARTASADPSAAVRHAAAWAVPPRETLAGRVPSNGASPADAAGLAAAELRHAAAQGGGPTAAR